jgi:bacteriocin-like protein
MKKKNLRLQTVDLIQHTKEKLPAKLVELSEKDLQQIVGGFAAGGTGSYSDR